MQCLLTKKVSGKYITLKQTFEILFFKRYIAENTPDAMRQLGAGVIL